MKIYLKENDLIIRSMLETDAKELSEGFQEQGWPKPLEILTGYYVQQEEGVKKVIIAEVNGKVAGHVTLLPKAEGGPFAAENIPEIIDFNVFIKYQKQGIGNKILDITEMLAKEYGSSVSLSVGLHSGYGSAQRMYVKRGYIPDGSGVWYKGKQLEQYVPCVNDDDLILFMKKEL